MTLRQAILLVVCILIVIPTREAGIGSTRAESASITQRPCFGAAARSPASRCVNPGLGRTVFPSPADALLEPNAACDPLGRAGILYPCGFGARGVAEPANVTALIGDSHASHWRAAVDVVAAASGWPAVSITRSGCPFSKARPLLSRGEAQACRRWNGELLDWLRRHKQVTSIFVSHHAMARYHRERGVGSFETAVRGHLALWNALPRSVRHIFVIRDTPVISTAAAACVRRTFAHRQASAVLCARARREALRRDPAVEAAGRTGARRVHVLDMTPYFCDRARCYPVVGGALVHKDSNHITAIFAKTLGRFMLRSVQRAIASERPALDALLPDERGPAECVLSERALARQAGGWQRLGLQHLRRAQACRVVLEERARKIFAAGLTGTFNRKGRFAVIRAVLDTDGA